FTQAQLLRVPAGMRWDDLRTAVAALLRTHDALRARFVRGATWTLRIGPDGPDVDTVLTRAASDDPAAELGAAVDRLDPAAGRMLAVVWSEASRRLLVVVHHLVVDSVSWRILVPDLRAAWEAAAAGREPRLGPV